MTPADVHADGGHVLVALPPEPDDPPGPGMRTRSQTSEKPTFSSSIVPADDNASTVSRGTKRKTGLHDGVHPPSLLVASTSVPITRSVSRRGASDPRRKHLKLEDGSTPLPLTSAAAGAGNGKAVAALLKEGAGVKDAENGKIQSLFFAIHQGDDAMVVTLLRAGADVEKVPMPATPFLLTLYLTSNPSNRTTRWTSCLGIPITPDPEPYTLTLDGILDLKI